MAIVIAASVWRTLAFTALLFLGALQIVPREVLESAALDGGSRWRVFWGITFPLIRPTLLVAILITSIRGINSLGLILATTSGGPGGGTTTAAVLLYLEAWKFGDFGMAAAMAVLLFALNLLLTFFYLRSLRAEV
jgi:ABC-type sugar transport system permease subunit